ncbi:UbiA family prenyltransferase [Nocardioides cavernaquae]|uniref:Ubiquinone biosynthesis protein UbiA n=1 Tax=Nocardioides cavernaquae TaxID=2321396 RepID=A0A3A5HE76_9ACTN|nr:UbiA family prenyltransferase [Nocardioides cavernaquae]RJS46290.1 hypothetical protein D4739_08740 [Nocardioides cavernaquae]
MSAKSLPRPRVPRVPRPPRLHGLRRATRVDLGRSLPVTLVRASHPRQALITAIVVAVAAALTGRPLSQAGIVFAAVLVGQAILGWHNDLLDVQRDRRLQRTGKPIAQGQVEHGQVWFALICAVLLVVPLSVANGVVAGSSHLMLLGIALVANSGVLRRTRFSYLMWMASFALWPAFLSYGGAPNGTIGEAPSIVLTLLSALLGIGIHVLTSLPGLVDDNKDGIRHFPLTLALRTGAPRLLVLASVYTGVIAVAMLVSGLTLGVSR